MAEAATARMQSAATPDEIGPHLLAEARRFPGPARRAFRQPLHAWAKKLWIDKMGAEAAFPSFEELEQEGQEMATALQMRWARYDADMRAEERELGLAEGRELGLELGLAQGREVERVRLRRQAALKFGAGTADQLAERLADLTAEDLERVGDWIIECGSGDELLLRVYSVAAA